MRLPADLRQRFRRTPWVLGALASLLVLSLAVFIWFLRGQDLPAVLLTNRVLLYFLWNLDAVLILTILFVLLRNLLKLVVESRRRILGARLRTKLVATYIGLALGPVLLLFFYGTTLIQVQSERLFSAPVKDVLAQGNAVAQSTGRWIEESALRDARRGLAEVAVLRAGDERARAEVDRRLRSLLAQRGLEFVALYEGTELVQAVVDPQSGLGDLPEPGRPLLLEALRAGSATRPAAPLDAASRMTFAAATAPGDSPARAVLVVGDLLDPEIAGQSERLVAAFQQFRQLEVQRADLRTSDLLLFLLVTLLILLASSWVGFYLARRVTVPLQALSDATRRISEGDLGHRVEVEADDELLRLVRSFNEMTAEVERGRALLEGANRGLSEANDRLGEERAFLEAVLGAVAAGVVSIDRQRVVTTANRAALRLLDQPEETLVGRSIDEAWADPEYAALRAAVGRDPGHPASAEVRLRAGGTTRTLEVKVSPLAAGDGADAGGHRGQVVVIEDLSDLLRAQQSAAWSDAARRIAHEIKNPLTPIQLAAERVLERARREPHAAALRPALEEAVETIRREVESLKRMVDEFSRFARMPQPRPARVDVEALVAETGRLYREVKPGVEVTWAVAPEAREAWFDREQIKQVLLNLLDNAVEATAPPGRVTVAAERAADRWVLRVEDDGRGLPDEAREKVFNPYYSTKGRGSGLGLAIVQRIAREHQGSVRAEARAPRGTAFVVELPQ